MALDFKQNLKQSQSLAMSPQIQQAIKILTLGRMELQEFVEEELKENPYLEEVEGNEDNRSAQFEATEGSGNVAVDNMEMQIPGETGDFRGIDDFISRFSESLSAVDERNLLGTDESQTPFYEVARNDGNSSLHENIEEQLRMMHLTSYELQCALTLVQYLNDGGFLDMSFDEVSEETNLPVEDLEYVLSMIQKCEPVGVGARNLQECLVLQLEALEHVPAHVANILRYHWDDFEKQDLNRIARTLKGTVDEIKKAFVFIREHLDPRPARQFGDNQTQVMTPDVYLFKREDAWQVSLNDEGLPRLKISKKYEPFLKAIKEKGDDKDFVNAKMKSAAWILRALAERNKTILRVAEVILEKQKEFFEKGINFLKPLTLKDIAGELGLHESTISRTTTSKYLHSPRGIFEFKYFFNAGLSSKTGEDTANEAIKTWIGDYIKNESPEKRLSDQDIAELIEKDRGIRVARRTVAKYRESIGLASSSRRNKKF